MIVAAGRLHSKNPVVGWDRLKTKTVVSVLVLALAAGAAYFYFPGGNGQAPRKDASKGPVPVTVARAEARDMPLLLDVVGRGEAYESVTLKSRVDGQVQAMPFDAGQHVRRGEVLVRLDPSDFDARLKQAEANLARDEAQLLKAKADVARYQALKEQNFVSEEKVGEVRATAQAMAATVQADRAAAELARLQLSYASIRAPFDGVVGAKLAFPGAVVKTNDTDLAVVNRVRPLYVSFVVPEKYLDGIRAAMKRPGGLPARVTLPGAAAGQAAPGFEGPVRFIDNTVDTATGTIRLKATLANETEALAPGQFVDVSLVLEVLHDALVVPVEAVQQGPEGAFVYLVKPDQGVAQRPVKVTDTLQGLAIIAQGLAPGDTVVTDGQLRLTPNSKVQIKTPEGGDGGGQGAKGLGPGGKQPAGQAS